MSVLVPAPHCLYFSFVILSEVWESYASCLVFVVVVVVVPQVCLGSSGSFMLPYKSLDCLF